MAILSKLELERVGFKSIGFNVQISDKASIYGAKNISIGDNVRIDDFCILSAGAEFEIGSFVHIACYTALIGRERIVIEDFVDISMKCTIISSTSDSSGDYLTSPVIPVECLNTKFAPVWIKSGSVIYAHSLILPGTIVGEGAVVGAMSLGKGDIPDFEIWAGIPARFVKKRKHGLKKMMMELKKRYFVITDKEIYRDL